MRGQNANHPRYAEGAPLRGDPGLLGYFAFGISRRRSRPDESTGAGSTRKSIHENPAAPEQTGARLLPPSIAVL